MRILVTGGAGYIGSHTILQLLRAKHEVHVVDNFSNSSYEPLDRVKTLANSQFSCSEVDIRDRVALEKIFASFQPDTVVHFAGLKAVSESNENPLKYYSHNVAGSIALLEAMKRFSCRRIVFSSSATVYGEAKYLPYDESHPLAPLNPYGRTKYFVEEIIRDWVASWSEASAVLLRYFNPVGADSSGKIGEDPNGKPNNLLPYIAQVAIGNLAKLDVYGGDYKTRDGTGERDYIHVEDLARAHLNAIEFAATTNGCAEINVGTGTGATVLEMVAAFEAVSGQCIRHEISKRREGDVAISVAQAEKAERLLGWKAKYSIKEMCESAWRWQLNNPDGYRSTVKRTILSAEKKLSD